MGFPPDFLFGTANADHQVEAYDPAREDVWDLWERCQKLTARGRATDFENRYEEDIASAANIGCKVFRFSIAWARVEPECGKFDEERLAHYRKVAESVKSHGMQLMITLHHFVWPLWLERDHGGMIGKEFPDLFARYADRVSEALGDLADWWITFNEPSQLTFGYIKPWWQSKYYMPPGLPRGSEVDLEAEAVGRLIPNLFRAHARARTLIRSRHPESKVGVNPLVTGFPTWLQKLMDWGACHRGMQEALFKFTTKGALVSERGDVDLVIGGISDADETRHEFSDPYVRTSKAVLVKANDPIASIDELGRKKVGWIAVGNQAERIKKDLPSSARRQMFKDYDEARNALEAGAVDAVYGDAFFLFPDELKERSRFRLLADGLSEENYVVLAPHGHARLVAMVDRAISEILPDDAADISPPEKKASVPCSLHEVFEDSDSLPERMTRGRGLRRVRRRGRVRIGLRVDAPGISDMCGGCGLEMRLARQIAVEIFGDESALEIIPLVPTRRLEVLESKSSWLNWAWRFWGTTSMIANASWWYLGTSGRLPEELCPEEAVGAQDFVGLDYYWGLPTHSLHKFRLLEDAAHGRFKRAPVWPGGLRKALRRLAKWFPDQDLFIVENGCPPEAGGMSRGDYMDAHLKEVEAAVSDGIRVVGYNWWSITSNREWGHEFDPNTDFGLYFVNLDKDPDLKRQETPEVNRFKAWISKAAGT